MRIRPFQLGDESALHAVFVSAVHELASKHYSPEQIQAWAPRELDCELWARRMQGIQPFVVERAGSIVAYADIQPSGYIDHFFVSATYARQGIGSMLMNHIHRAADAQAVTELTSDVSLAAQPFFESFGFVVVEQRSPVLRGVVIPNAFMRKELTPLGSNQHIAALEALREEIDAIDARIVALLGERFDCTTRVGQLKSEHQLAAVDAAREARQMARFESLALTQNVPPALVQQIFRCIVDEVVDKHKQLGARTTP